MFITIFITYNEGCYICHFGHSRILQYIISAHFSKIQNLCISNEIVLERREIFSSADNFAQDINELTVGYVVCRVHYFHLGSQH